MYNTLAPSDSVISPRYFPLSFGGPAGRTRRSGRRRRRPTGRSGWERRESRAMKSRRIIAAAVAVAFLAGLPGVYLVCLAAGWTRCAAPGTRAGPKTQAAEAPADAPVLPDPPESVKVGEILFSTRRTSVSAAMKAACRRRGCRCVQGRDAPGNGWEMDENWEKTVGASTKGAISVLPFAKTAGRMK